MRKSTQVRARLLTPPRPPPAALPVEAHRDIDRDIDRTRTARPFAQARARSAQYTCLRRALGRQPLTPRSACSRDARRKIGVSRYRNRDEGDTEEEG